MSGAYTYPGVYIQELPNPVHAINGVPTAITVLVGAAARGPMNEPVSIASVADYGRTFGSGGSLPLDQAVGLFYQNGGGAAYVCGSDLARWPWLVPPAGDEPAELKALSPGAWGNGLSITDRPEWPVDCSTGHHVHTYGHRYGDLGARALCRDLDRSYVIPVAATVACEFQFDRG